MRRLPPVLAALLVLSVPSALAATKTVDITQAGFTPKNITIDFGDTVTWTNKDTANHQVLADQVAFPTSPVLAANQSYSHTFTKSGNFDYRDAFNTNRRGSITVRAGVTLKASAPQVAYGGSVTLSGVASSGAAGETVTLDAMECGKTTFARVASVRSVAQGAWSSAVKPTLNTVYRSSWRNARSRPARREGRTGDLAQATQGRPLFGHRHGRAVVRRKVRRPPALRPHAASLEDRQASHPPDGQGRHRADDDHLRRLPGARDSRRSAQAAPHAAAGRRLLRAGAQRCRSRLARSASPE